MATATANPKGNTVTAIADKVTKTEGAIDLSKMDLAALKKLVDEASATFTQRKTGELKTLVNGWLMKADAVGYSIGDVLNEVRSRLPQTVVKTRAKRGTAATKKSLPYEKGVLYTYQAEEWRGGTRGRRPVWLRDLIPDTMPFDEQKAKYEELAAK